MVDGPDMDEFTIENADVVHQFAVNLDAAHIFSVAVRDPRQVQLGLNELVQDHEWVGSSDFVFAPVGTRLQALRRGP